MLDLRFKIKRVSIIDEGAFGVLMDRDIPFALTLERTYALDLKIPQGIYRCTQSTYHKGGYPTYEIHVPGHHRILFHKGNVESDLDGCIAIGEEFGILNGKPAVLRSGKGFAEFMAKAAGLEYFDIDITN